jgi:4-hydroxybenzoate polyprenyltransferase
MNYKVKTAWIFVALLLSIALMMLYPTKWVIGLGIVGVPLLIVYQAFLILRANEKSEHTFSDEKWYDDQP